MTEHSDRVREMAYFLGLEEGCPEGEAERHWLAAKTLLEPLEGKPSEGEPPSERIGGFATVPGVPGAGLRSRYLAWRS